MGRERETVLQGETYLGIELGSTRIKAVLIGRDTQVLASGSYGWENRLENGIWTYSLEDAWKGLQGSYASLKEDVKKRYGVTLTKTGAVGISGMMHGYLVFDEKDRLLTPFRTWRNTITGEAASRLTELFQYNIPQRWSIAHLYQSILNQEEHVPVIRFMTTLAGYIHWKLTGVKAVGVGEASGMFPIDPQTKKFCGRMLETFEDEISDRGYAWRIRGILPEVLSAGEQAGILTEEGARLLDTDGDLEAGIPLCPPEGDAGTGMVATNSVAKRTGNVSAGTSVFAMIVLEQELKKVHPEIDLVTTPDGSLVGMVHCNNCTSDLNAWVNLFGEFAERFGIEADKDKLYEILYRSALEGDADCGGLLAYNYFSGEHLTGFEEGRPLFVRMPDAKFSLANFMRVHLFTALGALKTGLDILFREEGVQVDSVMGHGGLFKTKEAGQRVMAAAMDTPVVVMETAGEGGAWGIALLASYMQERKEEESLGDYLAVHAFADKKGVRMEPDTADVKGFDTFLARYTEGLAIERVAVEHLMQ